MKTDDEFNERRFSIDTWASSNFDTKLLSGYSIKNDLLTCSKDFEETNDAEREQHSKLKSNYQVPSKNISAKFYIPQSFITTTNQTTLFQVDRLSL